MKTSIFKLFIVTSLSLAYSVSYAQNIGINTTGTTPNNSAILDLNTGNNFTSPKGMGVLIPNVALTGPADAVTIATPPTSLLVYVPVGSGLAPAGYYYNAGTPGVPNWVLFTTASNSWLLTGNAGTTPGANFIGSTDAEALEFEADGQKSGWIDFASPFSTSFGFEAANANTAIDNVAFGYKSLRSNTAGTDNTALGFEALTTNSTGNFNTAVGSGALQISTGNANTSIGYDALYFNTGGSNTAVGYFGLLNNTSGIDNTTLGAQAGWSSSTASDITALGAFALKNNTAGFNTAIGYQAGQTNTLGTFNTFLGIQADASANSFINATAIGNGAVVTASNNMMFGNTSVIGWGFGATPTAGSQALVVGTNATNGNGANLTITGNWTSTSDSTKKHDIQNIRYGLSEIMKLRPVSYTWKGTDVKDIGFLAQEVKHILPEVVYGEQGHMTLSYGQITPVLTKAIQEQQKMIDDLKTENDQLKNKQAQDEADIASLKKMVNSLLPLQASAK